MQGSTQITSQVRAKLEELRRHVEIEGESPEGERDLEQPQGVWEMKATLTYKPGDNVMWAVASDQDWTHDALEDIQITDGTIYADDEPFFPSSVVLNGYFQAEESGKWARVSGGKVALEGGDVQSAFKDGLESFEELVEALDAAMEIPAYRHMAEKSIMKQAQRERYGAFSLT